MSRLIQRLDAQVASQIAAGEVIERPVSVVKELLENALDAGATQIRVDVEDAGVSLIRIEDNGIGIWEEDLHLAVEPHATSKIKTLVDLYHTQTKGFRGEALASIASVSKMMILSKPQHQPHAMSIQINNGQSHLSAAVRHQGTTIEVRDLFYNVPVRKKFLKSHSVEWQAIELMFKNFPFLHPKFNFVYAIMAKRCWIFLQLKFNKSIYIVFDSYGVNNSMKTQLISMLSVQA